MTPAYLAHFGLDHVPLSKEIADADLWLPPSKEAIVHELEEAIDEHASVLLTGEPGAGKTCVLRALRHRLPQAGFRLTYCHNATLGRRDFYRQLCLALGLSPSAAAAAVFFAVSSHVEDLGRERVHPVFSSTRPTCSIRTSSITCISCSITSGTRGRSCPSCSSASQSSLIGWRSVGIDRSCPGSTGVSSSALSRRTTPPNSLRKAGGERELFTSDAVAMLHEAASGSLRDLDRLATAALCEATRRKRKLVERDVLGRVIDLETKEAA